MLIISRISKSAAKKKWNITTHKNVLSHIKMGEEILMFGDNKIEKNKFYHHKSPIFLRRCSY